MTLLGPSVRPLSSSADAAAFRDLNRRWIAELFSVTPEDERLLSDPRAAIIGPGGQVLLAVDGEGEVLGVVAVLSVRPGTYELVKMTVADASRGRGIGRLLVEAAVQWTREQGGRVLFLGTSSRLAAALRIYDSVGFERTTKEALGLGDYYDRADTFMTMDLTGSA